MGMPEGTHELFAETHDMFATVRRHLMEKHGIGLLVDIGANTGQYGTRRRSDGFTGQIISFEPLPDAYLKLCDVAHRDGNWAARQVAVGENPGVTTIHVSANSYSSSLLPITDACVGAAPEAAYVGDEQVQVTRLDDEIQEVAVPTMIKIDTQGTEISVLRGGRRALGRAALVEAELSLAPLYAGQTDPMELCSLVRHHGLVPVAVEPEFSHPETGELLQVNALFARVAR
jgi:FkbM family methyltransferase